MSLSPEDVSYRSRTLRAFLDAAAVQEALQNVETEIVRQWKTAATADERENCWRKLSLLEDFIREMRAIIDRPLTNHP